MPFFEYSATDSSGKRVGGRVQSPDSNAARTALANAGLKTIDVWNASSPKVVEPQIARPTVRPPVTNFPTSHPIAVRAEASTPISQATTSAAAIVRTRSGNDKDLYFILTQLSGMQHAGIAPSSFLQHLANQAPKLYKDSLIYASARVGEGSAISDCLERYPDLYPAHVIGHIRVGEKSGYLAEGVTLAADSVNRAHRLKRRLAYFPLMACAMLVIYPLSMGLIRGSLDSIKAQDKAGGTLPVGGTIVGSILENLKLWGPIAIGIMLVTYAVYKLWQTPALRRTRHQIGLVLFRERARSEAVTRLAWALSRSTQAGIPYYAAYQLSTECIPNEVLRESAIREAAGSREGEPLSGALRRSNLLPQQYADVVETGELTGDVPKAMDQLAQYAASDFEGADAGAAGKGMIIFYAFLGILTAVLVVSLAVTWYSGIIQWGLSEEAMGG